MDKPLAWSDALGMLNINSPPASVDSVACNHQDARTHSERVLECIVATYLLTFFSC